jgi:hypothetical protein
MTKPVVPQPIPLFDLPAEAGRSEVKTPALRSVRQGKCPACKALKTGLLASGQHIVWRPHNLTTWGGTRVPCRTSGVAVCVAPERDPLLSQDPAICPHDR